MESGARVRTGERWLISERGASGDAARPEAARSNSDADSRYAVSSNTFFAIAMAEEAQGQLA